MRRAEGARAVWLLALLALAGCPPGGEGVTDAGGGADTATPDHARQDQGPGDNGAQDTGSRDAGTQDSGLTDQGAEVDARPADTGAVDRSAPDQGTADTMLADGGPNDSSPNDSSPNDSSPNDSGPNDAGPGDRDGGASADAARTTPEPLVTPASGTYPYRTAISLTADGADIYLTVDGTTPTLSSARYQGQALAVTARTPLLIRAMAVAPGLAPSAVVSREYHLEPGMIIHLLKPAAWGGAYMHYWSTTPDELSTVWPGVAMTPEGGGWYSHVLADQTATEIVFNGGGAPQTADLFWGRPDGWYTGDDFFPVPPERFDCCAFPGGRYKALVWSYDDGPSQDERLIQLFNARGIKGSFNINSGFTELEGKIPAARVAEVYAGHEVAVHTVSHPHINTQSDAELRAEFLDDRAALEALVGYPVRGLAYPFGDHTPRLLELLIAWGFAYGRVVPSTDDFRLPGDLLLWRGTAHHTAAWEPSQRFIARTEPKLGVLFIWGHAWELDAEQGTNSWAHMEALCDLLGGHDDVWYASAIEVADYLNAVAALEHSPLGDQVRNPSAQPVWLKTPTGVVELAPGATLALEPG